MDDVNITFDEQGKIRVLEPEIYQKTQDMRDCAEIFTKSINFSFFFILKYIDIGDFSKCVEDGLIIMDAYAKKIEKAKLRAISQRNMTQNELESCSRRQVELNALLKEKQEELERYIVL